MKNIYKLISLFLTVLMLLGTFSVLFTVNVFAADDEAAEDDEQITVEVEKVADYTTQIFATPEEKLATMTLFLTKGDYQLYVDEYSGEVACVNTVTGEKLFTNPYDVGASTGNEATKQEILSQIIVKFTDKQGQNKTFTSFQEAVLREQVIIEPIKNGLRVEYTIGREQSKTLVPRLISYERFQQMIIEPAYEAFGDELYNMDTLNEEVFDFQRLLEYYVLYDKDQIESDRQLSTILAKYPIVDRMPVYVFDPTASDSEIAACEEMIITYCSDYTYEELEYDHALTEYESQDENPPVFRMALEYKIDEQGLTVRLPANGIRFNESLYTLSSIEVLPYMGAGNSGYSGYNFFPDGSGALFDFEQLNTSQTRSVLGKVYGTDYAYHEITGKYQKTIRYPVFGIVEDTTFYTYQNIDVDTGEVLSEKKIAGAIVEAIKAYNNGEETDVFKGKVAALDAAYGSTINNSDLVETKSLEKSGFVAIIEEGDALASLTTYHAGSLSDYNTIKMQFTPRPKDTYNLKDSISVGANDEWTVVSKRKYVGGYKIRYLMLSEPDSSSDSKTYDASWFGMAIAYRDYLTNNGIISKMSADDLTEDIPLYIESFGAVETTQKIMSVPVTVTAPLTTFGNILEMYNDLSSQGITNVNFKLTGFANGGLKSTVPSDLKFEKSVGGNDGFQELLDEAAKISASGKNNNLGIFPDFDFAYSAMDEMFDTYKSDDHAAKTIDDRYANKREYSATQQKYINYHNIVVSPAYFSVFYNEVAENYANKYENVKGISVSTLGSALNSDFDEDEPYNREDSKSFTVKAFEHFENTYDSVMTDGGNSYVWKYVDHMLDVSLDSSRYNFSSNAVPFLGVVLHGSVSIAGAPLNMEGDIQYAILKAIENGASPYFVLSYQNTQALKEYEDLSKYYSIRYDIWKNDIADVYMTLNGALSDVQDKYIVNHEFLTGNRIPDSDELEADILAEYKAKLEAEKNAEEILKKELTTAANTARENGRLAEAYAAEAVLKALELYDAQEAVADSAMNFDSDFFNEAIKAYRAYEEARAYSSYKSSTDADEQALYATYVKADAVLDAVTDYNMSYDDACKAYDALNSQFNAAISGLTFDSTVGNYKSTLKSTYDKLANATKAEDKAKHQNTINEIFAEAKADLDAYNRYTAAEDAYDMVISSGFTLDFNTCFNACLAIEETTYFSGATYKKAATSDGADAEIVANYDKYVSAKKNMTALESMLDSKPTKGSLDNYLAALAQVSVMDEMGYAKTTDTKLASAYKSAQSAVTRTRTTAVNAVARLDASTLDSLKEILRTSEEYLELAVAAIEVVAGVEGDAIVWDTESDEFLAIKNESELSFITVQAIERARNTYKYIEQLTEGETFVVIPEGKESDVEWNGHKLMYNKDANGEKIYIYGSREAGYSYFTMDENGELQVYLQGDKINLQIDGLYLYEAMIDGVKRFYTASMENGYTYYVNDSYYNKYLPATAATHNGEAFAELEDGTVIYREISANGSATYYSVDENSAYTLYNYYQSIRDYCEGAIARAAEIREVAAAMATVGGDDSFDEAVQARIDRDNMTRDDETDEEIVEEYSRYSIGNIVAVTYGNDDGTPYKTMILNYNNYTVTVVYDNVEYTIPAYEFVVATN